MPQLRVRATAVACSLNKTSCLDLSTAVAAAAAAAIGFWLKATERYVCKHCGASINAFSTRQADHQFKANSSKLPPTSLDASLIDFAC